MIFRMTKETLKQICKQNKLYLIPSLNDVLYLHFKDHLQDLNSLIMSHNKLSKASDIAHLVNCKSLSVLDLSFNHLDDPEIIDVFTNMESLRVLSLTGNSVISKIKNYRKTLTIKCKELCNLDERPIFKKDRLCAEAWSTGGIEAEQAMRFKLNEIEQKTISDSVKALMSLRRNKNVQITPSASGDSDGHREGDDGRDSKDSLIVSKDYYDECDSSEDDSTDDESSAKDPKPLVREIVDNHDGRDVSAADDSVDPSTRHNVGDNDEVLSDLEDDVIDYPQLPAEERSTTCITKIDCNSGSREDNDGRPMIIGVADNDSDEPTEQLNNIICEHFVDIKAYAAANNYTEPCSLEQCADDGRLCPNDSTELMIDRTENKIISIEMNEVNDELNPDESGRTGNHLKTNLNGDEPSERLNKKCEHFVDNKSDEKLANDAAANNTEPYSLIEQCAGGDRLCSNDDELMIERAENEIFYTEMNEVNDEINPDESGKHLKTNLDGDKPSERLNKQCEHFVVNKADEILVNDAAANNTEPYSVVEQCTDDRLYSNDSAELMIERTEHEIFYTEMNYMNDELNPDESGKLLKTNFDVDKPTEQLNKKCELFVDNKADETLVNDAAANNTEPYSVIEQCADDDRLCSNDSAELMIERTEHEIFFTEMNYMNDELNPDESGKHLKTNFDYNDDENSIENYNDNNNAINNYHRNVGDSKKISNILNDNDSETGINPNLNEIQGVESSPSLCSEQITFNTSQILCPKKLNTLDIIDHDNAEEESSLITTCKSDRNEIKEIPIQLPWLLPLDTREEFYIKKSSN
ncbi:hypothetical protein ACI65C_003324 [Semiaphis heraclei]